MGYWRLYYHIVWATKDRVPLITEDIQSKLYGYISRKVKKMNCILHALGGIEDHVHLVVSIPPKLSIADFIANIKGSSSHYVKAEVMKYILSKVVNDTYFREK
jgi:putative transposase